MAFHRASVILLTLFAGEQFCFAQATSMTSVAQSAPKAASAASAAIADCPAISLRAASEAQEARKRCELREQARLLDAKNAAKKPPSSVMPVDPTF